MESTERKALRCGSSRVICSREEDTRVEGESVLETMAWDRERRDFGVWSEEVKVVRGRRMGRGGRDDEERGVGGRKAGGRIVRRGESIGEMWRSSRRDLEQQLLT